MGSERAPLTIGITAARHLTLCDPGAGSANPESPDILQEGADADPFLAYHGVRGGERPRMPEPPFAALMLLPT